MAAVNRGSGLPIADRAKGPFSIIFSDHYAHSTTKTDLSAAHRAHYFRKVDEEGSQEEARTVRTIF